MYFPKYSIENHPLFNCGNLNCPICAKAYSQIKIERKIIKENFLTDAVAPFVGRFGYPDINIGILAPPEENKDSWMYDAPKYWADKNFQIPKIVDFRSSLINSRFKINVKSSNKYLELNKEMSMASKPVDTEISLKAKPKFRINYDNLISPFGPYAELKKAVLTSNPRIDRRVQKVHYDTDLKASDALIYLYKNNFDENFLSRILSVGNLGIKKNRKLVPTRWSITSVDSNLGNYLVSKIKRYKESDYMVFFGSYLGNYYLIMFFPDVWSYELFETHSSDIDHYMTDFEPYRGRKSYAANTAGGFYACRLGILEKLERMKRQASILSLRFITGDYTLPLGVFVCREATRKSLLNKIAEFDSKESMLRYSKSLVKKKFNLDLEILFRNSILLKEIRRQSKLSQFI